MSHFSYWLSLGHISPVANAAPVAHCGCAQAGKGAGLYPVVTVAQQAAEALSQIASTTFFLKEKSVPDVETAAGDGNMDVRVLIAQGTVSVEDAESAHLNTLLASPRGPGAGGATEQIIKQPPVIVKGRPHQQFTQHLTRFT